MNEETAEQTLIEPFINERNETSEENNNLIDLTGDNKVIQVEISKETKKTFILKLFILDKKMI